MIKFVSFEPLLGPIHDLDLESTSLIGSSLAPLVSTWRMKKG